MKLKVLSLALLVLAVASCSKVERNERKFYKAMHDENYETASQAFDDFCEWLQDDKATMTHDFALMREKMGMKIVNSADGLIRCYSWPAGGSKADTSLVYANVMQWKHGDQFVAYAGPLDRLISARNPDFIKQKIMAHNIDTIIDIRVGSRPVYLVVQSYFNSNGRNRAYVTAMVINGIKLTGVSFFFDGISTAGNMEYNDDGKTRATDLFKWDDKTKQLSVAKTDDQFNVIPGQYIVYQLDKTQMVKIQEPTEQEQ